MIAKNYSGDLKIMEQDKQDEWKWFSFDHLPERIYSPSKKFIDAYITKHLKNDDDQSV